MKIKEKLNKICNNISDTYFRIDFGFMPTTGSNGLFIIPTIEFNKTGRFIEINIWIFCSCFHMCFTKENYYDE